MWKLSCAISGLLIGAAPALAGDQSQDAAAPQSQPAAPTPSPTPRPTTAQRPAGQTAPTRARPTREEMEAAVAGESTEEIVVTGQAPRGSVQGTNVPPEQTLTAADVRAYGVSSVNDLLNELGAQTGTTRGGGGPVILVNGRRISGPQEVATLPSEAIERVEILPEEAALQLGYSADQRVVNIVLRPRFRSITTEIGGAMPFRGGRTTKNGQVGIATISDKGRFNLDVQYTGNSMLLESERNVRSTVVTPFSFQGNITPLPGQPIADPALSLPAGTTVSTIGVPTGAATGAQTLAAFLPGINNPNVSNIGDYRSLSAANHDVAINSVYNRPLSNKISGTINLRFQNTGGLSYVGPATATLILPTGDPYSPFAEPVALNRYVSGLTPLARDTNTNNLHAGVTFNGDLVKWRWSVTGNYDRVTSETITDASSVDASAAQALLNGKSASFNPFAPLSLSLLNTRAADRANSTSSVGQVNGLIQGPITKVPAGNVNTSLRIGFNSNSYSTRSFRSGVAASGDGSRRDVNGQFNINLPLTSKRNNFLGALGDFTLNGNIAFNHLSDFGTLTRYGAGLFWSPAPNKVFLNFSYSNQQGAPSQAQLGDPTISTPNVRTYDFVRGETVDVTTVTGGNRALHADHRDVWSAGINVRPFSKTDFNLRADYNRTTVHDAIASFPTATAELEAAFPQRFLRDASGRLIQIDTRPVNFDRTRSEQLRWGFNLTLPIQSGQAKKIAAAIAARQKQIQEAIAAGKPVPPMDPAIARQLPFGNRRSGQQSVFGGPQFGPGGPRPQGQQGRGQQGQGQPGDGQQAPRGQPNSPAQPGADGQQGGPQQGAQNFFFNGGTPPAGGFGGGGQGGAPGGGGGFGGQGGGGFRGGGAGGFLNRLNNPNGPLAGRLMFSLFHTWQFRNDVLIHSGVPLLDLLNGSATGNNGGQPRHRIEAQAGFFKDGFGYRLTGNWQSATHVTGGVLGSSQRLNFSSLATVNAIVFADLGRQTKLVRSHPFFQGSRVSLQVSNVFDQRLRVTDQNGATPLSYQPDLIDPIGRSVRIGFRKLFF